MYGADLRIRYLNPPARRAIRLPAGVTDPIGVHLDDLNYPADLLTTFRRLLTTVLTTGQSAATELYSPRPESVRCFQVTATPLVIDGRVDAIASVATDITALRDAHRQLADQAARFRDTIRAAGVFEWRMDSVTRQFDITPEYLALLGLKPGTVPLTTGAWFAWFHPEDRAAVTAIVREAMAGRKPGFEFEYRTTGTDGVERWFLTRGAVAYGPDGGPGVSTGVTIDITDRKRAELALADTRDAFHRFMTYCPAAAWIMGDDGRYEFVNARLELNAGRPAAEILGRTTADVFPSDVAALYVDHDRQVLATGQPVTETEFVCGADGRQSPCLVVRFPLDSPGHHRRLGGFSLDISELHRLQEEQRVVERQLLQTQKLESLGVLAGGIAHDFNNLLTGVLGYASLARLDDTLSADTDSHLRQIEAAAQRAAELCKQMLAYAGRGQVVVQPLDLNHVVWEMAQLLATAVSKRAVLKFNLAAVLPAVQADATQIRQVVMNLITNASDAIAEQSGVITLSTGLIDADPTYLRDIGAPDLPPCQYVYLEVSDTGVGMTDEVKARIFEPFYTTKFTGRGLGLAAVQGIVRAHVGAIKIYSQPGKGTTFKVLLPTADGIATAPVAPPVAPPPTGRQRWVLVVDDEEDGRVLARKILTRAGFQVDTACDGQDAMEAFRAIPGRYAAVLLDLTMPRMNGVKAFRLMRQAQADVKVILTSGYAAEDATTGFEGKGLVAFVRKPFLASELLAAVAAVVGE